MPTEYQITDAELLQTKKAFDLQDVMLISSIGRSKILEAVADGSLIARRNGAKMIFRNQDVDAWLDSLPTTREPLQSGRNKLLSKANSCVTLKFHSLFSKVRHGAR